MEFLAIVLVQAAVIGGFCAYVAEEKNRNAGTWFGLGLLFSLPALVALVAMPRLASGEGPAADDATPVPGGERTCPFCAENVKVAATVCRFCQRDLPPVSVTCVSPPLKIMSKWSFWVDKDAEDCIEALAARGWQTQVTDDGGWIVTAPAMTSPFAAPDIGALRLLAARAHK